MDREGCGLPPISLQPPPSTTNFNCRCGKSIKQAFSIPLLSEKDSSEHWQARQDFSKPWQDEQDFSEPWQNDQDISEPWLNRTFWTLAGWTGLFLTLAGWTELFWTFAVWTGLFWTTPVFYETNFVTRKYFCSEVKVLKWGIHAGGA